jgi:anti-anti-sigma factor
MSQAFPPSEDTDEPRVGSIFSCFRLSDAEGSVRLMMIGELDLVTADRAHAAIRRAQDETSALTCDLGDVWFVDLAGLRVLLDAAAHAMLTGRPLTLANCPPIVPRMLRLLRLGNVLEIQAAPSSPAAVTPGHAGLRRLDS